jgi:hypothetical protein
VQSGASQSLLEFPCFAGKIQGTEAGDQGRLASETGRPSLLSIDRSDTQHRGFMVCFQLSVIKIIQKGSVIYDADQFLGAASMRAFAQKG